MVRYVQISISLTLVGSGIAQLVTGRTGEIINNPNLLDFEKLQLTDKVISVLQAQSVLPKGLSLFSFGNYNNHPQNPNLKDKKCKTYPGDEDFPSAKNWGIFNYLLGNGALIETIPEAATCYPDWANTTIYSPEKCETLTASWNNSTLRVQDPTSIRSILFQGMTCMPPNLTASFLGNTAGNCEIGGFPAYSINVSSVVQIQLAVNVAREAGLRLVIKNTGHDFGGKSTGMGGLNIWTRYLKGWRFFEEYDQAVDGGYKGPAFQFGAGIQAFEAFEIAKRMGVTVVGGEGKTVGLIGGYIQGGGHSPLTSIYGMAADHVLSINLVTADGRFITADARNNSDIFWAIRGGGGSTFGVVTSMVVKAFPRLKTSILTYNMTTSSTFSRDTFWKAQRAYVDHFEEFADKGYYSYYRIRHLNGEIFHDMNAMVAPNTSEIEFRETLAPLFKRWEELGVPFTPFIKEYDNFHDAWKDGFPQEVWMSTMRQASRIFPRENIVNETKRAQVFDSIRGVFEEGANLVMFNIRSPPGAEDIDNAVNPAWRDVLMFAIMFVTWQPGDSTEYVTQLSRNLTHEWNPRWKALTPGGGTYMSESDYIEPEWQESFHGDKYARLLEIKRKVDPWDVFYATNAVGSEAWELEGTLLGHLPSQNSRLCRN